MLFHFGAIKMLRERQRGERKERESEEEEEGESERVFSRALICAFSRPRFDPWYLMVPACGPQTKNKAVLKFCNGGQCTALQIYNKKLLNFMV